MVGLWSGTEPDALYDVHSSPKGAAFPVVAVLVQDGALELDREVTCSWPEVAAEGKGDAVPSSPAARSRRTTGRRAPHAGRQALGAGRG